MKSLHKIAMAILFVFSLVSCQAQIKNAKTETVKVYGNCGMCKKTIEKASNENGVAKTDWNVDSNMLTMTYDATKTNPDAILKKVADAGYDSDKFKAPDDAYNNLHTCCQYDRPAKGEVKTEDHSGHQHAQKPVTETPAKG
jgi:copper chaperone CopZ